MNQFLNEEKDLPKITNPKRLKIALLKTLADDLLMYPKDMSMMIKGPEIRPYSLLPMLIEVFQDLAQFSINLGL